MVNLTWVAMYILVVIEQARGVNWPYLYEQMKEIWYMYVYVSKHVVCMRVCVREKVCVCVCVCVCLG